MLRSILVLFYYVYFLHFPFSHTILIIAQTQGKEFFFKRMDIEPLRKKYGIWFIYMVYNVFYLKIKIDDEIFVICIGYDKRKMCVLNLSEIAHQILMPMMIFTCLNFFLLRRLKNDYANEEKQKQIAVPKGLHIETIL